MDGIQVAERVKAECPGTPILLISAYGEPRVHRGDAFIPKPFDNEQLVEMVRRYLDLGHGGGRTDRFSNLSAAAPSEHDGRGSGRTPSQV